MSGGGAISAAPSVRPMRDGDFEEAAVLAGQLGYPATAAELAARFLGLSRQPGHVVFVADCGGRLAGWLHACRRIALAADDAVEVVGLVVDAERRGRGIGRLLMARAESWAAELGVRRVYLRTNVRRQDAHRFYSELGYELRATSHLFDKTLGP